MKVEIERVLLETAGNIAAGVPYALKATAARLAEEPDLGVPSALPGILSLRVDGSTFEDCPDLDVGYIREPDWIQIRFARAVVPEPEVEVEVEVADGGKPVPTRPDPAAEAVTVRQVADAWGRVTGWLRDHAPDSYAGLRPGADPAALAALEAELGLRIPVELRVLWLLTAGDDGADGVGGCLPRGMALMDLDAVAAEYRLKRDSQAHHDASDAGRPEEERITVWRASWIPVIGFGPGDATSGLYLDAATGFLGPWSRFIQPPVEELDTLVTYLEEIADMLAAPALATRDQPGLVGGALAWGSSLGAVQPQRWRPLTG